MKKILVIEDEDIVRENIIEMLSNEEFEPVGARDGEEGFNLALSVEPDLIISDIRMPKLDGIELLNKLQENSSTTQIPFIFLTAKVEMQDIREGMALGADDYLTKPFSYDDLMKAINTRLKKKENYLTQIKEFRELLLKRVPHELRTPLVGILGLSDIMKENIDSLSKDELLNAANIIYRSGSRLHRRIEKFLTFSDLISQSNLIPGDIKENKFELMKGNLSENILMKARALNREEDIIIELENGCLKISANQYNIILDELFENSLKFSKKGTPVSITGKPDKGFYITVVKDYGSGIQSYDMKEVELFNQFNKKTSEEGLGFGLAIVKKIMESCEGYFKMNSEAGIGTTVEIGIPLYSIKPGEAKE